jgi:hypothetical protein
MYMLGLYLSVLCTYLFTEPIDFLETVGRLLYLQQRLFRKPEYLVT